MNKKEIDIFYYKWNSIKYHELFSSITQLLSIKSLQFYMPFYSLYFYIHNKHQSNIKIDLQRNFYIRKIKEIIKERYYHSNLILLGSIYDSSKNKLKARGYFYVKKNDYFYKCHNCNHGCSLYNFLKIVSPALMKDYQLERFKNGENKHSNYKKPEEKENFP